MRTESGALSERFNRGYTIVLPKDAWGILPCLTLRKETHSQIVFAPLLVPREESDVQGNAVPAAIASLFGFRERVRERF